MCDLHDRCRKIFNSWCVTNIFARGMLLHHAEADDEPLAHVGGHHVDLARGVDVGQQLLVHLVHLLRRLVRPAYETEAHQAQLKTVF